MGFPGQRSSRPRRAERVVLALGIASSLAMVLAALQIELRPDWMGEFALDDAARRVSAGVADEWRQLVREPDRWIEMADDPIRWELATARDGEQQPTAEEGSNGESFAAFDALLDQAQHREITAGDLDGALTTTLAALELPCDAERRARARLRVIQLSRRLEREEEALTQWWTAREEASGSEIEDGVSCLLLGALVIAPLLSEAERLELRTDLIARWSAGELALPSGAHTTRDAGGRLVVEIPLEVKVLADELQALAPDESDERLGRALVAERGRALGALLGGLPVEPLDGSLGLQFLGDDVLAYRMRPGSNFEGTFMTRAGLREALGTHLRSLPFFPSGFSVDLRGDREELGVPVSPPTPLLGDELGYTLRHEDPEGFMVGEERRLGVLQASLLAMAAFTLLTGIVSFQALRRQRVLTELKGRFVASVSHELRTPVTGILLATENLAAGRARTPERLERYHELIRQEALRLRRLVDDVLDFSRLERGIGAHLQLEQVSLEPFIDELVGECRTRVEQAGLVFGVATRLEVSEALIDQEALRRAVSNLVDNAIRHSDSQAIELSVVASNELVIQVDDRGRGVSLNLRKTIFEPFRQVSGNKGSSSGAARGAGLGLAIVREICRGHGGSVLCLDGPGGTGTRFELRLPTGQAVNVKEPTHE